DRTLLSCYTDIVTGPSTPLVRENVASPSRHGYCLPGNTTQRRGRDLTPRHGAQRENSDHGLVTQPPLRWGHGERLARRRMRLGVRGAGGEGRTWPPADSRRIRFRIRPETARTLPTTPGDRHRSVTVTSSKEAWPKRVRWCLAPG